MGTKDLAITNDVDMDKEPETDPCPAVGPVLPRLDDGEDDLEKRLAWLAKEVRATSAEHAKKKRATSILEAREYKTALVPTSTRIPTDLRLPKVEIAPGVAPQLENTIERRRTDNEWEVDVAEPEELARTLPLDPHAPVPDPLPFHAPTNTNRPRARGFWVFAGTLLGGIAVGIVLQLSVSQMSQKSGLAAIPRVQRVGDVFLDGAERIHTGVTNALTNHFNAVDQPEEVHERPSRVVHAPNSSSLWMIDVKPSRSVSTKALPPPGTAASLATPQSFPYKNPGF